MKSRPIGILESSMAFSCPTESKGLLTVAQKMMLLQSNARTEDPLAGHFQMNSLRSSCLSRSEPVEGQKGSASRLYPR